jgi:hypothetical protein
MPFYVSLPLPGPFRWSHRIGMAHRRHRGRFSHPLYWLTGLAVYELAAWAVLGTALGALAWRHARRLVMVPATRRPVSSL